MPILENTASAITGANPAVGSKSMMSRVFRNLSRVTTKKRVEGRGLKILEVLTHHQNYHHHQQQQQPSTRKKNATTTSSRKKKIAERFAGWRRKFATTHDEKDNNTPSQHHEQHQAAVVDGHLVVMGYNGRDVKYKKNNIRYSNVVPHRSTNLTRSCLTSLSRREAVLS